MLLRAVMLHPVRVPPSKAGSLPPWMFPRGIPSAALHTKQQVPSGLGSSRASSKLGSLSLAPSGHLTPHGQPGGGARPPGSAPLHRRPPRRPPPTAKMLRAPACGIVFVPHIMPPAPQDSRSGAASMALRERRSCRPHRRLARPPPGATASSAVLVIPGASSTPYQSLRAAWSFLRDHLTPRPAVAKSTYRFCIRKIRCAPALQNTGNQAERGSRHIPWVPGEVGWASMAQAVIC